MAVAARRRIGQRGGRLPATAVAGHSAGGRTSPRGETGTSSSGASDVIGVPAPARDANAIGCRQRAAKRNETHERARVADGDPPVRAGRPLGAGREPPQAPATRRRVLLPDSGLLTDPRSWRAVEVAERFADGLVNEDQLRAAFDAAEEISPFGNEGAAGRVTAPPDRFAVDYVLGHAGAAAKNRAERKAQCDLVRDIFGNPFRPVAFSPAWRTDTTLALARQVYEPRDFGAMPILADALQDAGCDNADILNHCRAEGVHVRGCWVVDLVLGKE